MPGPCVPVTRLLPCSSNYLPLQSLDTPLTLKLGLWRQAPLLVLLPGRGTLHCVGSELPAPLKGLRGPLMGRISTEDFEFWKVGVCLTQVAPTCSMRGWWKNTHGIRPSWRPASGRKRRAGHTWPDCDGRTVSGVHAVAVYGRGRFGESCLSVQAVATKPR